MVGVGKGSGFMLLVKCCCFFLFLKVTYKFNRSIAVICIF